jgi:RsiW-degrading membrane proteinase PrsW (M82 family)
LLRFTLRNLELPPAQQGWSVFGVTLVMGPLIGIILEGIALIFFALIVGLYLAASHPEWLAQITNLAQTVQQTSNPDTMMTSIAPLFFTPVGMLVMFGLFSVAIPVIEEATKVMALWLFADKIKHPAQGFALGVLCGAAFALAESLGYASTGSNDWMATATQRASAALPHMLNTGILGWALVSAWKERAYIKLGAAYLAVMLIHGLWNAISIALLLNTLIRYTQQPVPPLIANPIPLLIGWGTLIIGTFGGLIYCNQALRRSKPAQVP